MISDTDSFMLSIDSVRVQLLLTHDYLTAMNVIDKLCKTHENTFFFFFGGRGVWFFFEASFSSEFYQNLKSLMGDLDLII